MKRFAIDFPRKLAGIDFNTLESSKHTIYALSSALELIYFNPAYVLFAKENSNRNDLLEQFPLQTPIVEAINGEEIRNFYLQNYETALVTEKVWHHEFECSEPHTFRRYYQSAYPLKNSKGLILINKLVAHLPINRKAFEAIKIRYVQPITGLILQCSNCRCTQRASEPEIWDWVPDWVESIPKNCSHSICPPCLDYYWKYNKQH